MDAYGLPLTPLSDRTVFTGSAATAGTSWETYIVPPGKSMLNIFMLGGGGGGGSGVVGANSVSAGGGGGGSGGQTVINIPIALLPRRLYISVGAAKTGAGLASYVNTQPQIGTANQTVGIANGGSVGGNASAGTGGAAGGAASAAANSSMPLGWGFVAQSIAGQAGIIGGAAVSSGAQAIVATGLRCMGGGGGGGLPAAAVAGTNGGAINGPAQPSYFPTVTVAAGGATATTPPTVGKDGFAIPEAALFYYPGQGGGSTHGSATGAGLVQASGGKGAIGCGGGGMGGALTGSTAGVLSMGGPGLVIITAF